MDKKVGLIGVGAMGRAMANKMLENNVDLILWNRTTAQLQDFVEQGVHIAETPQDLVTHSEIIIFMLTDAVAIESVLSEMDHLSHKCIIQMGTITPADSITIAAKVKDKQGYYFEAPVLGSIPDINAGRLIIMVGGEEKDLIEYRELFTLFGPKPLWIGGIGDAATLKLAMNQLIGSLTCAFSSSLSLILKKGIDLNKFMDVVRDSALYAPTYDKKLANMLNHDFKNGNFSTKHLLKDLNFFIEEAGSCGIETHTVESVRDVTQATVAKGMADDDYSALFTTIANKTEH